MALGEIGKIPAAENVRRNILNVIEGVGAENPEREEACKKRHITELVRFNDEDSSALPLIISTVPKRSAGKKHIEENPSRAAATGQKNAKRAKPIINNLYSER